MKISLCGGAESDVETIVVNPSKPLEVLGATKRLAISFGWRLSRWEEFKTRARKTLDNDASPESLERFHAVVREYFEVTT